MSLEGRPLQPEMDEVLLTSHLRRADAPKEEVGEVKEGRKPRIPFIVLPREPRFTFSRTRVALDIVYTTPGENNGEVLLNFKKFYSVSTCVDFLKEIWTERTPGEPLFCTGGGSFKYADLLSEQLNVKFQYKPMQADAVYPFLLVNIGTGISILKVDSPTEFQRVGGSSMGGGAFIGLGNLLTNAKNFDELLLMAERGDHRKVDTLVSDIYGGAYDHLNLAGDVIAGSFAKCTRMRRDGNEETMKEEDLAKSLLLMISNTIGQMAMLYGHRYDLRRIYFGGFFIRKTTLTMRTLSYAIDFWSKGKTEALFLKHEGYLGAVGTFLSSLSS